MTESPTQPRRADHAVIVDLIPPHSRVLDLGCGDGELLWHLIRLKDCHGTGIEIDEKAIYACMARGLTVSHGDIDSGLDDYSDKRFDYVILNESLQEVLHPERVIDEALRVGKKVIVGVPNFGFWKARWQLFLRGRVPVTKELPYQWYNTPNLRFFTIKDFLDFCRKKGIKVLKARYLGTPLLCRLWPNLFANIAIFVLEK